MCFVFHFSTVYVIIVVFCLASATALFSCLDAVMDKIGCGTVRYGKKADISDKYCAINCDMRQLVHLHAH